MAGPEPDDEDEFPPRRPFGVPARPAPVEPVEPDETGASQHPAGGAASGQPPATRS
jgi:hypothetical protein